MTLEDILKLIQQGEGVIIEFKEAKNAVPADFYETVVSFAKYSWPSLILQLVPSWHQKGTQLDHIKWPINQIHTENEIKKVPSWQQKGTQLLTKRARYLISILMLTTEPIKLSKLMQLFNYKNEKIFRDNYIKPLREANLIMFTNPTKPSDPDNKYIITSSGKAFLGGTL